MISTKQATASGFPSLFTAPSVRASQSLLAGANASGPSRLQHRILSEVPTAGQFGFWWATAAAHAGALVGLSGFISLMCGIPECGGPNFGVLRGLGGGLLLLVMRGPAPCPTPPTG